MIVTIVASDARLNRATRIRPGAPSIDLEAFLYIYFQFSQRSWYRQSEYRKLVDDSPENSYE